MSSKISHSHPSLLPEIRERLAYRRVHHQALCFTQCLIYCRRLSFAVCLSHLEAPRRPIPTPLPREGRIVVIHSFLELHRKLKLKFDTHKTDKVDKASEVPSKRRRASADKDTSIGVVAKVRGVAEQEGRAVAKKRKTGSGGGINVDSTPTAEPTNASHASSARRSQLACADQTI